MRRYKTHEEEKNTSIIRYNNIEIDIEKSLVFVEKKEVSLTKNEFDILLRIFSEDGKLVPREALMKEVIGYDQYIYDRTIDTHIKNLRRKIGDKGAIITVRGK